MKRKFHVLASLLLACALAAQSTTTRVVELSRMAPVAALANTVTLAPKVRLMLSSGTNLPKAAEGFQDTGVFLATAHASQNLHFPFDRLKTLMTGPQKATLVAAIHQLWPEADAKAQAKKASIQAREDLESEAQAEK